MKHLHPSNSRIQVHEYPLYEGEMENMFDDCYDFIESKCDRRFLVGHSLEHRTGQRIKGYKNDTRFEIRHVYLLYRCFSKNSAIKMEDALIKGHNRNENQKNIRKQENWKLTTDRMDSYIVYLCTE